MNFDILNINNKLIIFRKLYKFDFYEFNKFYNENLTKDLFIEKYLHNINIFVKVGFNIKQDKIVLIVIYKNCKINKLIYNQNYDFKELKKKIILNI